MGLLLEAITKEAEANLGFQWFQVILDKPLHPWNYEVVRNQVVSRNEYLWWHSKLLVRPEPLAVLARGLRLSLDVGFVVLSPSQRNYSVITQHSMCVNMDICWIMVYVHIEVKQHFEDTQGMRFPILLCMPQLSTPVPTDIITGQGTHLCWAQNSTHSYLGIHYQKMSCHARWNLPALPILGLE